jgi:hypothetical protein
MRPLSILPVLVVMLGIVSEAGAAGVSWVMDHDYEIAIGPYHFGFADGREGNGFLGQETWKPYSKVGLGPLGTYNSPFTATHGLIGFCVIVVGLIALVTVFTMRWKRKRAGS